MSQFRKARKKGDYKVRRAQSFAKSLGRRVVRQHVNAQDPTVQRRCTSKRRQPTRKEAAAAVSRAERKSGLMHRSYHCNLCGEFHIARVKDIDGKFVSLEVVSGAV